MTDRGRHVALRDHRAYAGGVTRIFAMPFSSVYPLYIAKLERKGRTKAELDEVIEWLTGFDAAALQAHLDAGTSFAEFFDDARLNPDAALITGVICGVRVEQIDDPLMQKIRYLDKLVDELARGKAMQKVLRVPA
jgi:hypothetical protein